MKLIVGLGNPGKRYQSSMHNVGFLIADAIKKQFSIFNFQFSNKFKILKPQSFMNQSGGEVIKEAEYYKIKPKNIIIIHDELDLDFGTVRVSFGSSSAGHNGVKSIIENLKTQDFWRVRVGIGRPPAGIKPEDYVLQVASGKELACLSKIVDQTAQTVLDLLSQDKLEEKTYKFEY